MNKKSGFTLIELLSVVLIIGILTAVALPQYRRAMKKAQVAEAVAMLRVINDSAQRLAAGYGYKNFSYFLSSADASKFNFQNLDMFDNESINCSFETDGQTMTCRHFVYTVAKVDGPNKVGVGITRRDGVITATGRFSSDANNNIQLAMVVGDVPQITCSPKTVCETYGFYAQDEEEEE